MIDRKKMYKYHQENVLAIEEGLNDIQANIRSGIIREYLSKTASDRKKASRYILIQSRILSGLIVSWSEEIIKRLYYEPNAYSDLQIEALHNQNLQQKWEYALQIAFCKAYRVRNPNLPPFSRIDIESQSNVNRTAKDRYYHIMNLISSELVPSISIRNKVQHGEWIKAFNTPNSLEFSAELTREIHKENIVSLQTKINQFQAVYQLIHDLAVFKEGNNASTFERDFDKNYDKIENNKRLLEIRTPAKYKQDLIQRYERGIEWKQRNQPPTNLVTRMINRVIR